MTGPIVESGLSCDFVGTITKLDAAVQPMPKGMSLVDFVIEEADRLILVEVKNPSNPKAPIAERRKWSTDSHWNNEIDTRLVPKARGSYTYLHLMDEAHKPLTYVVVIDITGLSIGSEFLPEMTDALRRRLAKECHQPWARPYLKAAMIVTPAEFNALFAPHRITPAA